MNVPIGWWAAVVVVLMLAAGWVGYGTGVLATQGEVYSSCRTSGNFLVQKATPEGENGKIILCSAYTSEEILRAYLEHKNSSTTNEYPDAVPDRGMDWRDLNFNDGYKGET